MNTNPLNPATRNVYVRFIKPLFDKISAFLILLIASPLLLITIMLLFIFNRRQVWFIQRRPGKDERIFSIVKFKTMNDTVDAEGKLLSDDKRLTWVGGIIRKTSLDELPQLLNVLKGDMSIVGPRPLLPEYIPLYSTVQRKRHKIKPGITGWAQVNGRNTITWQQKFELDSWYVDNVSFRLDVKILLLTIVKVFKAEGVSSRQTQTMEKFRGNQ